ncbi:Rp3-like disease resistance protein [Rhynchospora pubera]|uniref:Rp3-like disease resistance protein n=1 Tax=Rhynchospora pubera TaxID=906938 RepID=A0AAV8ES77_9POAL|nr:Rp3-like disease resistance protein [Rhynchospora pubera]
MDGSTVVSTVVKIVGEKLGSAALKEFCLIWGVKDDLERLEKTISTVRVVLANAEDCCLIKNDPLYNWLRELKDVLYDADDVLDQIYLEAEKWKVKPYGQTHKFIYNVNPIKRLNLGHKIKSLNRKLDTIAARKAKFHLQSTDVGSREETNCNNRETCSLLHEESICGRDNELKNIVSQLKHIDANEHISIISIVGLAGLGKTTLARLIYNNEDELKGYFVHKMWVHVSQNFNVKKIVTDMIQSTPENKCEGESLETLVKNITSQLIGNRFLLVLDDIWNENQEDWDKLKGVLKCGAPGSKIIATTRSIRVSEIMKSTYTSNLACLSEEMSWNLFAQRAFSGSERNMFELRIFSGSERELSSQILEIAKDIVKKCGGVPLALKTLGSTMQFKKSVEEWLVTRDSEIWKTDEENEVMASLKLSYVNLSSHLKECFTYCSIFPKGYVIDKQDLINQWMANGLVSFTRSMGGMKIDQGNEYFEQLVQISFLQNVDEERYSTKVTCNMHDLVHDLAQSISNQRILHISDAHKTINKDNGKVNLAKIRKMRALHISSGDSSVISMVSKAQSLRSLFLENIILFGTLPISIKKLIHLRYICISNCLIEVIPKDIGTLWSLEALHLRNYWKIAYLPKSIGNLVKLRVLDLHTCRRLEKVPQSIGNLINLVNLDLSMCINLKCLPESVGNLDKLCFLNLHGCKSLEKVPESIGNLINLKSLDLSICESLKYLPESIGNLANLRILNLHGLVLETLPKSICKLSKLISLNLDGVSLLHGMPSGISKFNGLDIQELSIYCEGRRRNVYVPMLLRKYFSVCCKKKLRIYCEGSGNEYACMMLELEHLNIRDNLEISGLEYFNDPGEFTKANLKKNNLNGLKLIWYPNDLFNDSIKCSLLVLEDLEPPSSIKQLDLEGYPGEQYPNWMMLLGETRMTSFPNLTSLTLSLLERCSNLPSLAELPHLEYLKLELMPCLTNYSGFFPSLIELHLREMPNLEEVTTMKLDTENVYKPTCPRLSTLEIKGCPKVRMQPHLPPSVVELTLHESNEELLGVEFFNGESSSEICSSSSGIRELKISRMERQLVWLEQLRSLTRLEFWRCEGNCLPESMRHLSSLRELTIDYCQGLHALPEWFGELKSLERLEIQWTPLTCLPESMKNMSSLRELTFKNCDGFCVLPEWFGELKSLNYLIIWYTPLTCLPKSMKQLTDLQMLSIFYCTDELERRCESEKGEDWHLISHIPKVLI